MKERDCATCTKALQKQFGCDAYKDEKGVWQNKARMPLLLDGEQTWACPRRPIKDNPLYWQRLLFFYNGYKAGYLSRPGGLGRQSVRLMTLVHLMSATFDEADEEQMQKERQRAALAAQNAGRS